MVSAAEAVVETPLVFCGRCRGQVAAKASVCPDGKRSYLRCTCPGGPLLPKAAHAGGDRGLLEAAARAAGMNIEERWFWRQVHDAECGLYANNANGTQTKWNPLTDDGDALRLAVKLRMGLDTLGLDSGSVCVHALGCEELIREPHGDDPYAATRRAIVRAAAEIGSTS